MNKTSSFPIRRETSKTALLRNGQVRYELVLCEVHPQAWIPARAGMAMAGRQRGFSLVSAIFLLVVLAGLGAAMTTFSSTQNQAAAMDVMGSRAYQAASAGIEWAAYNIATNSGVSGNNNFGPTSGNPLGGNLADFEVAVAYTAASSVDDTTWPPDGTTETVWSYDITASAVWGTAGTENRVERVINAKM